MLFLFSSTFSARQLPGYRWSTSSRMTPRAAAVDPGARNPSPTSLQSRGATTQPAGPGERARASRGTILAGTPTAELPEVEDATPPPRHVIPRGSLARSLGAAALPQPAEHRSAAFNDRLGGESPALPALAGAGSYPPAPAICSERRAR